MKDKKTLKRKARESSAGSDSDSEIELIVEEPLEVRIDGAAYARVMRTPGDESELAVGFCITEGIINSYSDIKTLSLVESDGLVTVADIRTRGGAGSADSNALDLRKRVEKQFESRSSGGMCGIPVMNTPHPKPLPDGPCISTNDLKKIQHDLVEGQLLGWRTRATHAAGIFQPQNGRMVVREDIGRHNALDKAVGFAAATGLDLSQTCLMFSGRISLEIVNKCARARIGLIAAVSAASAQAVVKADSLNMTLIGRLRDENYVIYTHTLRII